ncbi:MAG: peptidylprolyl isomerase [Saprospiraceae bacterium]|nr:peptidylprolyl isomerase [Saprospiraceae bacterium]
MQRIIFALCISFLFLSSCGNKEQHALISTEMGDIRIVLYDSTPRHKDNFVKLVKEGFYDGLLFHRVMKGFMIQGGDPQSRTAAPGTSLGNGGPGYTIPHEIGAPHFRGAMAAARTPDNVNPDKESSGSQFYLVDGRKTTDAELNRFESMKGIKYNDVQRQLYLEKGGTPQLDGDYTVFGEVVEGMDVVDAIASAQKDRANRPLKDITMTIKLVN